MQGRSTWPTVGAALVATMLTWSGGTTPQPPVQSPTAAVATTTAIPATTTTSPTTTTTAVAATTTAIPTPPPTAVAVTTASTTAPATKTTSPAPGEALLAAWLLNVDGEPAAVISDSEAIPVNVQTVDLVEVDGVAYMQVTASGIPDY